MAEQRKATDAAGKGLEEDPYTRRQREKEAQKAEIAMQKKAQAKIPKWKQ